MYEIRLQQFEGPLDLLLFFIRRDELDIYDIPIASIADEFLEYVRVLEQVDLDGVGDFLYMAALLINIKTRMLLPSQEVDEDGEPIDPRQELVERLLEYMRFKEASEILAAAHDRRQEQFTRGMPVEIREEGEPEPDPVADATVFDLVQALRRVLTEAEEDGVFHEVEAEGWSLEGQQEFLEERLRTGGRHSFVELARGRPRGFIIATFLAILEMARNGLVALFVERSALDFYLAAPETEATGDVTAS
ncbi:MAG: segregation/condensation protein A [Rhodothermales bacterium]|nr:segregation/condensation protein A [Rhodothermales bacterium]MBO6781610.1 segregation/condensation protein A [Rhodothermales bacterium]